ncbi:MAG TPA: ribosome silencing factor [Chitinophagales bacterium]|nr:ribosome silencing factor [Chitinophagales bacterium]HMX05736.1 ribosome silencing factor [Chitinophagales bacterium]HMZ89050.1 ribosome silencing factor [Chitinophagales bacterium]HNA56866.1 ribosome silencing factor [Chitinophagales bacterium]HNE46839.1 ribosome silencing factor [Chitinophagales bacterium]
MRKSKKQALPLQYSLTELVIDSILDKKGEEVVHLDLTALPDAVSDHFIICHADSTTQVRAIGNHILENVFEKSGDRPFSKEGLDNAEWIIIDYMDVVVHVFYKEKRYFYQLEDLWHDAVMKKVS